MPPKPGDAKSIVAPKPRKATQATQQIYHILMDPLQSKRFTELCEKHPSFNEIVDRYRRVQLWLTSNGHSYFLSAKQSFIEARLSFYEFSKPPTYYLESVIVMDLFAKWEAHCHEYASDQVLRGAMRMFPGLKSLMSQSDRVDEWMDFNGLGAAVSCDARREFIAAHKPKYIGQYPNACRSEVTAVTIHAWCEKTLLAARINGFPDDLPQ